MDGGVDVGLGAGVAVATAVGSAVGVASGARVARDGAVGEDPGHDTAVADRGGAGASGSGRGELRASTTKTSPRTPTIRNSPGTRLVYRDMASPAGPSRFLDAHTRPIRPPEPKVVDPTDSTWTQVRCSEEAGIPVGLAQEGLLTPGDGESRR